MDLSKSDDIIEAFCLKTARQAGEMILAAREKNEIKYRYKNNIEPVTSIDESVDCFIRDRISAMYPDDLILSEEGNLPEDSEKKCGSLWVVDPVDGTVNFIHGQDCVAVSIAFVNQGQVRVGVVYAPFHGEMFVAVKGKGAWRDDSPIGTSKTIRLRDSLIGTGFPHDRTNISLIMPKIAKLLQNCQDIRRFGSPALDICFVADGRLDGFYEGELHSWDVAAAGLIAREAGAVSGFLSPIPDGAIYDLYGGDIVITTPAIFQPLIAILTDQN